MMRLSNIIYTFCPHLEFNQYDHEHEASDDIVNEQIKPEQCVRMLQHLKDISSLQVKYSVSSKSNTRCDIGKKAQ